MKTSKHLSARQFGLTLFSLGLLTAFSCERDYEFVKPVLPATGSVPQIQFMDKSQKVNEGEQVTVRFLLDSPLEQNVILTVHVTGTAMYQRDYVINSAINRKGSLFEFVVEKGQLIPSFEMTILNNNKLDDLRSTVFILTDTGKGLALGAAVATIITIADVKTQKKGAS